MRTDQPKTIYLKDYKEPDYKVKHLDLKFVLEEEKTTVTSDARYYRHSHENAELVLDGEHMKLISIHLDGEEIDSGLDYHVTENKLTIIKDLPASFDLKIVTEIDPAANTALEGLYKSQGTYCTQCEAEGFRRITYYQDRPDILATFTTTVEADQNKYPVLLSNGNLKEAGELSGGRHYTIWEDPFPKPCYLFALVAGDLVHIEDHFKTMSGRDVTLRIYVRDGDQGQCDHAMESLKHSMKWDEEKYGREYELDLFNIVAVSDFNMGAMENTSLNIFNTALVLAHQDTATDHDFERVEGVIAHEYFHNWTGNRVTCRDWFQLSLKEGLTVFRDQEFTADMNSRGVKRIDDVSLLRRVQFPEDSSPMAHPVRPDNYIEINNFYTVTVYEKGAEVIRMQHNLLGEKLYRDATDLYFERYDGQAVTCDDFVQCMEDASGIDLTQFKLWYSQAGTPEVYATADYHERSKTFTLELAQHIPPTPGQKHKEPMHIPVAFGLIGANGEDLDLGDGETTKILHLKEKKQKFTFKDIDNTPVPSILRGFSAPVKLTTNLTVSELCYQMVYDSDGFNRWEAGQTLALRMIMEMLDSYLRGEQPKVLGEYVESFGSLLSQAKDSHCDKALLARALQLPTISFIGQQITPIDPAAIYAVMETIQKTLSNEYLKEIKEIYEQNRSGKTFSADFSAQAQRALQNTTLRLLCKNPYEEFWDTAKDQYDQANNMTDRVAALGCLSESNTKARDDAFADYYDHFKDYQLVVDKWFALQASATRPQVLQDIQALKAHEEFNIKNPNRVRSLYAAFAMNNPVYFHDVSGDGYKFLADAIIDLNKINPQIASRLLTPFREWRRYTDDRQKHMQKALERIAGLDDISPNVYEIVSKTLAAPE